MNAECPLDRPSFLLRLLGPPQIQGPHGLLEGGAVQRHRLALMALLAAAPRGLLSRDRLMGQLWPEASAEHARNLLNAAVHAVRRAIGDAVLISQGAGLQLDRSTLRIDVVEFDGALARGDAGCAIQLYTGHFLDGLSLPGAVEFEHWVDQERDRLQRLFHTALEQHAATLARDKGQPSAVPVWRRRLSCSPLEGRVVLELMKALEGSGDRAGAIQSAAVHESLLQSELGLPPDPDVLAFAAQLRRSSAGPSGAREAKTAVLTEDSGKAAGPPKIDFDFDRTGPASDNTVNVAVGEDPRRSDRDAASATRNNSRFAGLIAIAVGLLLGASLLIFALLRGRVPLAPAASAGTTAAAVFPFDVRGNAELEWMGEGLMDMLSEAIDGAGDLRRVDPRAIMSRLRRDDLHDATIEDARRIARELDAAHFVLASVTEIGGEVRLAATVYEANRNEPVGSHSVDGKRTDLASLVTTLARELLASLPLGTGVRLGSIRTVNTPSFEALKAYAQGEAFLRRSDFIAAERRLTEAVQLDPEFAIAWLRLSFAQGWTSGDPAYSAERAVRHSTALSYRDELHARGHHAFFTGAADTAEAYAAALTGLYRDDAEGWSSLAGAQIFYAWRHGRTLGRVDDALNKALELDPDHHQAHYHSVWLAMLERRYTDVESLLPQEPPDGGGAESFVVSNRAALAFATGDSTARARTYQELESDSDWALWQAGAVIASFTDSLDTARRLWQRLASDQTRSEMARATAQGYLAALAVSRGRFQRGREEFAKFAALRPLSAVVYATWFAAAPAFERPEGELRAIRDSLRDWVVSVPEPGDRVWRSLNVPESLHPWIKDYLIGLLSARIGDHADALQRADALDAAQEPDDPEGLRPDLAREIRALVAFRDRRFSESLAILEGSTYELTNWQQLWSDAFYRRPIGRLLRASALEELGRYDEALGWYGGFFHSEWAIDMVFTGATHLRIASIHERNGRREFAATHYRCFVSRWLGADPEYEQLLNDARSKLDVLDPDDRQTCRQLAF